MANKRIQDLTAKGSAIASEDLIEVSQYVSPGVYTTKSVRGDELGNTAVADTGTIIAFDLLKIYNSPASPATGNITDDLTGAKIGIVQKIYHNDGSAPTFPAGWVLLGTGTYTTSTDNVIYAEWVSGTRVEYWVTQ
jgi:hypothetical protein